MLDFLTRHVKYAVLVLLGFTLVMMLSRWTGRKLPDGFVTPPATLDVQRVVDHAAQSNMTAHRTPDPAKALVDITAALTALKTTSVLVGEDTVVRAAGVSPVVLENEMKQHQARLLRQLQTPLYEESLYAATGAAVGAAVWN
jgi:hypothetical protein